MSWKKLLEDKSVADDVKLNVNGIEVSVGDLRSEYKAFEKEQKALATKQTELEQAQATVATAYAKVLEEQDKLTKAQASARPSVEPGKDFNYDADPLFAPLMKQIKTLEEATNKYQAALDKQQKDVNSITAYYLNRQWQQDFNSITEKPADLTLKDALEFAQKQKIVDELGVPDVRRAVEQMAAPQRIEAIKKQAAEKAVKEYQESLAMASLGKPGMSGFGAEPSFEGKSFGSLDEAIAAAKSDPAIVGQLAGLTQ